jgi:hypothetical protein
VEFATTQGEIMSIHPADDSTVPRTSLGPFSSPGTGPTPWEETEWALRRIQKFQLCTVRRDQLGDAVRTGTVQLYRVQPDKGFAFASGSESSQTRYRWS